MNLATRHDNRLTEFCETNFHAEIVKVQIPLNRCGGPPTILVYNQNRSFERTFPASQFSEPVLAEMRAVPTFKAFFELTRTDGMLHFGAMREDQPW